MFSCIYFLLVFVCLRFTSGEVINIKKCPARSGTPAYCEVHEVKISPCPEATERRPCEIRRGNNYTMTVDFTPNFDAAALDNFAMLVGGRDETQSWDKLEKDACKHTNCPLESGKRYTYTYVTDPNAAAPDTAVNTVRWVIVKSGEYAKQCCFQMKLKYQ